MPHGPTFGTGAGGTLPVSDREGRTLATMPELPRGPTSLQPPDEITRSLFGQGRRIAHAHPLTIDALVAAVLLAGCTAWLGPAGGAGPARADGPARRPARLAYRRVPGRQRHRVRAVAAGLPAPRRRSPA